MNLLRELMELQRERGWLDDATLRDLARRRTVPLYRLEGLVSFYPLFRRTPPPDHCVRVCRDIACEMAGRRAVAERVQQIAATDDSIEYHDVSCLGRCDHAPAVSINDHPVSHLTNLSVAALPSALRDACGLANVDISPVSKAAAAPEPASVSMPAGSWRCDPYASRDQWFATVRELIRSDEPPGRHCVTRLTNAGLRGMGGAGFPTGRKWDLVAAESAPVKYVICNADESEPGTFKDREILRNLSHLVVEGMVLAGLAIGAERGIVYLRHEYESEQEQLDHALDVARRTGILGPSAAGSGRPFDIEVFVSPGGYILGEETALLEALEDKRGEPRIKPPYPGTHGLWGKPTLINNVETFALATSIIHHGADWWRGQAADGFVGLKFVSVSGDVRQPAVFEVPMGTPVRSLIEMAGGMADDRQLLAFLPGGASSNFLTADHVDIPIDFDRMKQAGSMLGTGALIVIGEGHDLFALATNLVTFFRNESCGKCVPCRLGSDQAVRLLESIRAGTTPASDVFTLPALGATLEQTSICGLGQVALNPILSLLKHFPDAV